MPIKLEIVLDDVPEVMDAVINLLGASGFTAVAKKTEAAPAKESKPRKSRAKKAEPAPKPGAEESSSDLDLDTVMDILKKYAQKHGRDAAVKIMNEVGKAKSKAEVNPENYAAIVKACKKAPAPQDEEGGDFLD